jgi:hypothetical protein
MSTLVDLWPDDISSSIVSPAAILRYQASQLEKRTNGILRGEVEEKSEGSHVSLHLVAIAPAVNGLRCELFSVEYAKNAVYPVTVHGPGLDLDSFTQERFEIADGQEELQKAIAKMLRTNEIRSTLSSRMILASLPRSAPP